MFLLMGLLMCCPASIPGFSVMIVRAFWINNAISTSLPPLSLLVSPKLTKAVTISQHDRTKPPKQ